MSKALEVVVLDQNDKEVRSVFDAAIIGSVQKIKKAGEELSMITIFGSAMPVSFPVKEPYELLRQRWLEARGMELLALPELKSKLSVV